ncbi:hypothetical protein I8J29_21915 [Paenibacillus sp. MWE-103]|uniref:Lipoprotein n=1 Tax=Paenibacillus artemisiicola TaxID=1172618 RepID=A0ABS3WF32_9BACL|nr:hypothetical protein [Paenibacillus artemisiicola]MBO7746878.1 hypothetical protein [Paenibacillus artemisiicola]
MRTLRWRLVPLLGLMVAQLMLAACSGANEPGAGTPGDGAKTPIDTSVGTGDAGSGDADARSTPLGGADGPASDPAEGNGAAGAASADGTLTITDIAGWNHPAKAILQDAPFFVTKVELTRDAAYPAFYVSYPGEKDLADHASLWRLMRELAHANGYWDFKLVNGQDGVTVEVVCDAAAKTVTGVKVNGVDYPEAMADAPQTGPKVPQAYLDFMAERHPLQDGSAIGFFVETDLNGDGESEAVLGVKNTRDGDGLYSEIYVLKQGERGVAQLGSNLAEGTGYGVYEIELVRLSDRKSPVVETKLTNGVSLEGFELIALPGKKPIRLVSSASPTGVGEDALIDADQNGDYDGYVQHRTSYDVLFYDVTRTYSLQRGAFVHTGTIVALPDYPADAESAVTQYLSLRALAGFEDAPEVDRRLEALCPACSKAQTELVGGAWLQAFSGSAALAEDPFDVQVQGDGKTDATANVAYAKDDRRTYRLEFHLARSDGAWVIDGIERPAAK